MKGAEEVKRKRKTVKELKLEGELAEAYKTIAEKDVEVQRLRKENAVLKKRLQSEGGAADDRERDVKLEVERKAEEIIPKEVWRLVFQKLDAEDLLNCRQVCKSFKELLDLKEFKVKWQFHLVIPQLFPYLRTSIPGGIPSWHHLYNPRLACRSWRHSIDKYASEGKVSKRSLVTRIQISGDIEEFQEKFGECNRSPFPSRSVCIGSLWVEDGNEIDRWARKRLEDEYNEKVGELLEHFGKHIFRLKLNFDGQYYGLDNLTLCKLAKRISTHLPNLRELGIQDSHAPIIAVEDVASYIAENQLAPLPKLQTLTVPYLNKKVADYLLDAFGPQLTRLEMAYKNLRSQFQMQGLKNVRELRLRLDRPNQVLESLPFLHKPLELLRLTCSFGARPRQQTWSVDKCLRNLKHLPINHLGIKWFLNPVNLTESGIDLEEYKNANIKTFAIKISPSSCDGGQVSFNFLQALTNLENLKLRVARPREGFRVTHPEELPEVVKLIEYLYGEEGPDRIYHSNVWEIVPSLKTITATIVQPWNSSIVVSKTIFTREEYERIRTIAEANVPHRN